MTMTWPLSATRMSRRPGLITSLAILGYRKAKFFLSIQARLVRVFHGQATVLLYQLEGDH